MTTFPIPKKQENRVCPKCQRDYQGPADSELCGECSYYEQHPEMAPGYWTWTRLSYDPLSHNQWGITTYLPERDQPPQEGLQVTVHRKDGSTSVETIADVSAPVYDRMARPIIRSTVK